MKVLALHSSSPQTAGGGYFESTGFGVPVGALFCGVRGATYDAASNEAALGIGGYDGTNNRSVAVQSRNGVTPTTAKSWPSNAQAYRILGAAGTGVDGEFDGNGFATDIVQFDCTDTFAAAYKQAVLMFGEGSVKVGSTTSFPANGSTISATCGFPPKVVFTFSNFTGFNAAAAVADSNVSFGVAHNSAGGWVNYCVAHWGDDGVTTTANASVTRNNRCLVNINGGSVVSAVEITASNLTQFTITTRDTGTATQVGWLAIGWTDDQPFYAGIVSSVTGTGTKTYTEPGFQPSFVGLMMTRCATINTIETDADSGPLAFSFVSGAAEGCYSIAEQDALVLGTTNTECMPSNDAIRLNSHDGTLTTVGNWSAWTSTGVSFSVPTTATDGTTRQWVLYAWGNHRISSTGGASTALTGTLRLIISMACTQAITTAVSAALTSYMRIAAQSAASSDMTAVLTGMVDLSSVTAASEMALIGSLDTQVTQMEMQVDTDTDMAVDLAGKVDLTSVTADVTFGLVGLLIDAGAWEVSMDGAFDMSGILTGTQAMSATLPATTTLSLFSDVADLAVLTGSSFGSSMWLGPYTGVFVKIGRLRTELYQPMPVVEAHHSAVIARAVSPNVVVEVAHG